jgi:hypothetical protein
MCTAKQVAEDLDLLSQQLWDIRLDDTAFTNLIQKVSKLSAQLAV